MDLSTWLFIQLFLMIFPNSELAAQFHGIYGKSFTSFFALWLC
jgi:hypothetical protein